MNVLYEGENVVYLDKTTMVGYYVSDEYRDYWGGFSESVNVPYTGGESTFGDGVSAFNVAQSGFYVFTLTDKGEGNWFVSVLYLLENYITAVADIPDQTYTGSAIEPEIGITTTLTLGTDYTITFSDNTNAGTAKATITGKGNYCGTIVKTFAIKKAAVTVTEKYTENSGGSGGGGGYRPPVVPDDDDDDNDDVVVNDPEDNEDKSDNGNEPQIKGDNGNTGWDAILDELDDADEGDKIVVDMNGETEVPEDVFEQIKGQDIDLVIEVDNGFIWTINGKDVTNPADIDLGVNKGSTIPARVINAVTGESEYITITLAHNGEFGFKAVLTVDMGVKNEGYFANLYWYTDNDTKFICADKIDNKGRANLVFTHASEYVIVIDENDHTPEDDVSAGAGIEEDSSEIPDDFDNDENPYTGVAISFAGIIIFAATIMIARKRKKQ